MNVIQRIECFLADRPWVIAVLVVLLFVIIFGAVPVDGYYFVDDQTVRTELERSYSKVILQEKRVNWLYVTNGCGRGSSAAYHFSAIAKDQPIEGIACVGTFTHEVFLSLK